MPTMSPAPIVAAWLIRWPLTNVPFQLPRSRIRCSVPTWRSSACRRETSGSVSTTSHSDARPMTTGAAPTGCSAVAFRPHHVPPWLGPAGVPGARAVGGSPEGGVPVAWAAGDGAAVAGRITWCLVTKSAVGAGGIDGEAGGVDGGACGVDGGALLACHQPDAGAVGAAGGIDGEAGGVDGGACGVDGGALLACHQPDAGAVGAAGGAGAGAGAGGGGAGAAGAAFVRVHHLPPVAGAAGGHPDAAGIDAAGIDAVGLADPRAARAAAANTDAAECRSAGAFAMPCAMTASNAAGAPGRTADRTGGGSSRCALITPSRSAVTNGLRAVRLSKRRQASE